MTPASGPSDTKTFHDRPRISASKIGRFIACEASFAREVEVHLFRKMNGIAGPERRADGDRGTSVHDFLSGIPFVSDSLGMGNPADAKRNAHSRVTKAAKEIGFEFSNRAEKWFCVNAIKKRDTLIEDAIKEAPVESVSIELDERRLFAQFTHEDGTTAEVSGLPDVLVTIARKDGGKTVVIADFKSLYGNHAPSVENKQLVTLGTLARVSDPKVDKAYLSLIAAGQLNAEIDVSICDKQTLDNLAERLRTVVLSRDREARVMQDEVVGSSGKLNEQAQTRFDSKATFGDHCEFCEGMACCGKIRQELANFAGELNEAAEGLKQPLEHIKKKKANFDHMTPKDLIENLREVRGFTEQFKQFDKLEKLLTDSTRKTLEALPDDEALAGVRLKPGKEKFVVRETLMPKAGEDELYEPEPQPLDTTPKAIFEKLGNVITEASKGEAPDYDAFLSSCCEVNPTMVKNYIAGISGEDKDNVVSKFFEPLSDEQNPFEMKPDRPSVELVSIVEEQSPVVTAKV